LYSEEYKSSATMNIMKKDTSGFTIVELLIVIAVIGILATISVVGFSRTQTMTRDAQRSSKSSVIVEALEKYYDKNGEYPSCSAVTSSVSNVTTAVLPGINSDALVTPKSTDAAANSIQCQDLTNIATDPDIFAYIGDGSAACTSGQSCLEFTLKYKDEIANQIVSIQSRRRTSIATANGIVNLVATASSTTAINLTWSLVDNATSYIIEQNTDSNFPSGSTTTSTSLVGTSTQAGLLSGLRYYYRVKPVVATSDGNWSNIANAATIINAPTAPTVTAALASSETAALGTSSTGVCASGMSPEYRLQYRNTISATNGAWSAWGSWSSNPAYLVSGASVGYQYGFQSQLRCVTAYASSAGVTSSNIATVAIPIPTPGAPTLSINGASNDDAKVWQWSATCPTNTTSTFVTAYYRDDTTGWRGWDWAGANSNTTETLATNYQGYAYRVKAMATCSSMYYPAQGDRWSAESNEPEFTRQVDTPSAPTNFNVSKGGAFTNTGGNTSQYAYYYWTVPACGAGTSTRVQLKYYVNMSNGSSILYGIFNSSDQANSWRTNSSSLTTNFGTTSMLTAAQVSDTNEWRTWVITSGAPFGIGNFNGSGTGNAFVEGARVYARYTCLNTVTSRYATGAPGLSSFSAWGGY